MLAKTGQATAGNIAGLNTNTGPKPVKCIWASKSPERLALLAKDKVPGLLLDYFHTQFSYGSTCQN